MNLSPLLQSNGPRLHSLIADTASAQDAVRALESRGGIVRFIRGKKASTKAALFDETAAALQFPIHFGENWDAFNDCLGDLNGLPQTGVLVIVFLDALHLLEAGAVSDRKTLVDILSGPHRRAIHGVFQAESADSASLMHQWHGLAPLG